MRIHAWEDITKQIEQEPDPAKIATLAKKLNEAMIAEERAKVRDRLGVAPQCEPECTNNKAVSR